jgi:hypothetical protein
MEKHEDLMSEFPVIFAKKVDGNEHTDRTYHHWT